MDGKLDMLLALFVVGRSCPGGIEAEDEDTGIMLFLMMVAFRVAADDAPPRAAVAAVVAVCAAGVPAIAVEDEATFGSATGTDEELTMPDAVPLFADAKDTLAPPGTADFGKRAAWDLVNWACDAWSNSADS